MDDLPIPTLLSRPQLELTLQGEIPFLHLTHPRKEHTHEKCGLPYTAAGDYVPWSNGCRRKGKNCSCTSSSLTFSCWYRESKW